MLQNRLKIFVSSGALPGGAIPGGAVFGGAVSGGAVVAKVKSRLKTFNETHYDRGRRPSQKTGGKSDFVTTQFSGPTRLDRTSV